MEPPRRQPQTQDRTLASQPQPAQRLINCDKISQKEISASTSHFPVILHPLMRFLGIPCSLLCFIFFICQTSALAARRIDPNNRLDANSNEVDLNKVDLAKNSKDCADCSQGDPTGLPAGSVYTSQSTTDSLDRLPSSHHSFSAPVDAPIHPSGQNTHTDKEPRPPRHASTCPCSMSCGMVRAIQSLDPLPLRGSLSPLSSTPPVYSYPLGQHDFSLTLHLLTSSAIRGVGAGVAASFGRDRIMFVSPKTGPPSKN